jgi:hypothetical protein
MAKFNFINLDDDIRQLMLAEIQMDIDNNNLFISTRLNEKGRLYYQEYLMTSVTSGDEESFEKLLDIVDHFNPTFLRQEKVVRMPSNASTLVCQSEFCRFYIRALCLKAISNSVDTVEIYRARESSYVRPDSEAKIGTFLYAKDLLEDLRNSIGVEPKLFPEINSGLCIKN